jgi:hypothetical protein
MSALYAWYPQITWSSIKINIEYLTWCTDCHCTHPKCLWIENIVELLKRSENIGILTPQFSSTNVTFAAVGTTDRFVFVADWWFSPGHLCLLPALSHLRLTLSIVTLEKNSKKYWVKWMNKNSFFSKYYGKDIPFYSMIGWDRSSSTKPSHSTNTLFKSGNNN